MSAANEGSLEEKLSFKKKYNDYEYPRVSVVIPCYNAFEKVTFTLESVLSQIYPDYEVILIDAGSDDRTLQAIHNYREERIRIYSVSAYQRYEMLNRGISLATGEYINFLFPGDYYTHVLATQLMMELAMAHNKAGLVYCGTFLRDGKKDPKLLFREISPDLLRKGQQPTSLQSCWFRRDIFKTLGKFNSNYRLRGGFEFFCRFMQHPELKHAALFRVLTDYDLRRVTRGMIFNHFFESFKTIKAYFGLWSAVRWFFLQKDLSRLLLAWFRQLKTAFFGG